MLRRSGRLIGGPRVPYSPGEDVAGLVDKPGQGASGLEVGQRVVGGTIALGGGGGYTESICLPADQVVPVPDGVDLAQAVCLVANYVTAHYVLHQTARVQRGERVLVHGAAGGVGSALLELGRLAGLELYGTASRYNHERVTALGATPIDYRSEDFVARIRQLTGDGVDVVCDPIGGGRQIRRSYRALRKGGRLAWFGVAATAKKGIWVIPSSLLAIGLLSLLPGGKQAPMTPHLGDHSLAHNEWYRETLAELLALLAAGQISPLVAERIPLVEAVRAHELLERGGYAGKVVLVAGDGC
jgi:NADPH:quinone reductase-like Zn-dependent oxidoreductase